MRTSVFFSKNWLISCLIISLSQNSLFGQIAIELKKMNLVVVGVDNPISVAVSDVPDSCLAIHPSFGEIRKAHKGRYYWRGNFDTTIVTLSITDTCKNEFIGKWIYRVRGLKVEVVLGKSRSVSLIGKGGFKAQLGIAALVVDDFDARCNLIGFDAHFFSKKTGELWKGHNTGARFEGAVLEKQQAVMPGDWVIFRQISYRCPGMKQPMFSADELFFELK